MQAVDQHRGGIRKRRFRFAAAWTAVFALLLQAMLPLGQAVAAPADGDGTGFQIVCTAYGLQPVPAGGDDGSADGEAYSCPICQIHAFSLVSPDVAGLPAPAVHGIADDIPAASGPVENRIHAPALPRGPPSIV